MDNSTNSPTSWYWYFGDGGTSTDQNPVYEFTEAGTWTVQLTATNDAGSNTSTLSSYITATTLYSPVASFTSDVASGTTPLAVQFTDTSTRSPTSWLWSFGDGYTSTLQNPSHTYTGTGSYTVTLTATNAAGSAIDTATDYIVGSSAKATTITTTPYATVAAVLTTVAANPVTTTANVSSPASSSGDSGGSFPVIGVFVALIICGVGYLFLRRPPRGSHGYSRREL
jgi:PKD repeat protein